MSLPMPFHTLAIDLRYPAEAIARSILEAAKMFRWDGGARLIFSASGTQTDQVKTALTTDKTWQTGVRGETKQEAIIMEIERQLRDNPDHASLQGFFKLVPITTRDYRTDSIEDEVQRDIEEAGRLAIEGHHLLALKNLPKQRKGLKGYSEDKVRKVISTPYAVQDCEHKRLIQTSLQTLEINHPGREIDLSHYLDKKYGITSRETLFPSADSSEPLLRKDAPQTSRCGTCTLT